jgi:MATE family multidrug resistance protein
LFLPLAWWWVTEKGGGPVAAIGAIVVYLALLGLAFLWRFRSGAWRKIELVEAEPVLLD